MIRTFKVGSGWVVSENEMWLPGSYESKEAAKLAASKDNDFLYELVQKVNVGEKRAITLEELETCRNATHAPKG